MACITSIWGKVCDSRGNGFLVLEIQISPVRYKRLYPHEIMILTENSTVYFLSVPESDMKICLFQTIDHLPSSMLAASLAIHLYL